MLRKATIVALTLTATAGAGLPLMSASAAEAGSISGVAFQDLDRDGLQDPGETAFASHSIYLFDSSGTCIAVQSTDATGRYAFVGLAAGTYRVEYTPTTWWSMRESWVPTTTGSLRPSRTAQSGSSEVSFGWRPITRSSDAATPLSSVTGPEGLRVKSYNDAVTAQQVYDALVAGLVGQEAASITVRFDLVQNSTTTSTVGATAGVYDAYAANSYVSYLSWLDGGPNTLVHEYGHAWSLYYAYLGQQDPSLSGYLQARGLDGDSRVGSSYGWNPRELIAEDYRQLLGSADAAAAPQMNQELPRAVDVAGLRDYLVSTFARQSSGTTTPSPTASPSASASPSAPSPSPSPVASVSPSPTATASKKGGGGGRVCRKAC